MKSTGKYLLASIFSIVMLIVACTKSNDSKSQDHVKAHYNVLAVGNFDTTATPWMYARTETTPLVVAEDSKLKAELIAYYNGHYVIKMTNKQPCQMILRWGWEDLAPVISIEPDDNTAGTIYGDVLKPNQVKIYTMIAQAKPGKIFVKAEKSNSNCPNSSNLVIPITIDILPIKYITYTAKYDEKTGDVTISFEVDDPSVLNTFIIQKQLDGKIEKIMQFNCDKKTKKYAIPIWEGIK